MENGDGIVDERELAAVLSKYQEYLQHQPTLEELMKEYDVDGNRFFDEEELTTLLRVGVPVHPLELARAHSHISEGLAGSVPRSVIRYLRAHSAHPLRFTCVRVPPPSPLGVYPTHLPPCAWASAAVGWVGG